MVVPTILAYFLNSVFNFAYFSFKFWIRYLYNTSKVMLLFIFLLSYLMFISNVIFEGNRSLKLRSSPSWLRFVHPPPIPLPPPSPSPPQFAANHRKTPRNEPLPSLEGCGLKYKCLFSFGDADPSAPPLSRGMWAAQARSMEETEEGEELRREIHHGRPRCYEDQLVRPEKEPRLASWFIFFHPSILDPPLTTFEPAPTTHSATATTTTTMPWPNDDAKDLRRHQDGLDDSPVTSR